MIGLRTVGTFAVILAFAMGFSGLVEEADELRTYRLVNHEVRTIG